MEFAEFVGCGGSEEFGGERAGVGDEGGSGSGSESEGENVARGEAGDDDARDEGGEGEIQGGEDVAGKLLPGVRRD